MVFLQIVYCLQDVKVKLMEGKVVMIKNFTKLLMANWILCLIVSFISSANASEDSLMTSSYGNTKTIHGEHSSRPTTLYEFKNENADGAVNNAYGSASVDKHAPPEGYLRQTSYTHSLTKEFYKGYDGIFITKFDAASNVWTSYDHWFDDNVIKIVLLGMKDFGLQMEKDRLPSLINSNRDTIRKVDADIVRMYSVNNEGCFIKFNLRTKHDILSSKWYSTDNWYYTVKANIDLEMELYVKLQK